MNWFLKILEQFVKEQNKNGTIEKKEQEWNDPSEGPRFRTERLKKSRSVPSST